MFPSGQKIFVSIISVISRVYYQTSTGKV